MDLAYTALVTLMFTIQLLWLQRTEIKRRRIVWFIIIVASLGIRHNAFLRGNLHGETLAGFIAAILLAGLFWLFIGRYNPVGSSDNIKVIGLND